MTFDSIISSLEPPFDPNDEIHMKILEHYITLILGEILFFIFERTSDQLEGTIVEILKDIFSHYATKEICGDFTCLIPFIRNLFKKSQEIWSRNFGMLSRNYFEECQKMLQTAIVEDLNNNEEDSVTPNLKITFYKHLCITPTRKLVSSHVLFLLNNFNHALSSKKLDINTKSAVLEALKSLLSHLTFNEIIISNSSSSMEEEKGENKEGTDTAMKLLWPSVRTLYKNCYKLSKNPCLKKQAVNVMITILRKSPKEFFTRECTSFLSKAKIIPLFEQTETLTEGLEVVYEMIKGVEKYGDYFDIWYPHIIKGSEEEGGYNLEFRCSEEKYECHRVESGINSFYEILSPRAAIEISFAVNTFDISERAEMLRDTENWDDVMDILYKILLQVCIEDIDYAIDHAIPEIINLAQSYDIPEYYVALKVAKVLVSPQE